MVRFLKESGVGGLDDPRRVASTQIEECEGAVVAAANNNVKVLVIERHRAEGRGPFESLFGKIGVTEVPYVRLLRHIGGHLLKSELRVRNADSHLGVSLGVPHNLGGGALDVVRVLEDHHSFGVDGLRHVLRRFAFEVLLEQIDFVVLLDALFRVRDEVSGSREVAKQRVPQHFFLILQYVIRLEVVQFFRPAADHMLHSLVLHCNALSVDLNV